MTSLPEDNEPRPFAELHENGLLWLLNRVVFHPRGYALALHFEGEFPNLGACTGWSLMGDGSEPWTMADPPPEDLARGAHTEDQMFQRVQALLPPRRPTEQIIAEAYRAADLRHEAEVTAAMLEPPAPTKTAADINIDAPGGLRCRTCGGSNGEHFPSPLDPTGMANHGHRLTGNYR